MAASETVRIGFVGVGGMGQMAHLRNYVNVEGCRVVALAELREKTARLVAERYGVQKVYRDHRAMLDAERLDGVVASQPFNTHWKLLPELYGRVKFLFTEKPLAVSVEAGEALAKAAADAGCTHMVGYHKRSDPATEYVKMTMDEWNASGAMGRLRYVRILMPAGDWIAQGFVGLLDGGDQKPALEPEPSASYMTGGGWDDPYVSFVNYYIHQVNLMRHLLGEPYRVTYAEPSGVLMAVKSASGVPGVIEMTPYRTTVAWEESALVAFEKGYMVLRLPPPLASNRAGQVEVYADPGDRAAPRRVIPEMPHVHAMRRQAENFVRVIRGEIPPPCDAAEAVEDLRAAREYLRLWKGR